MRGGALLLQGAVLHVCIPRLVGHGDAQSQLIWVGQDFHNSDPNDNGSVLIRVRVRVRTIFEG